MYVNVKEHSSQENKKKKKGFNLSVTFQGEITYSNWDKPGKNPNQ